MYPSHRDCTFPVVDTLMAINDSRRCSLKDLGAKQPPWTSTSARYRPGSQTTGWTSTAAAALLLFMVPEEPGEATLDGEVGQGAADGGYSFLPCGGR